MCESPYKYKFHNCGKNHGIGDYVTGNKTFAPLCTGECGFGDDGVQDPSEEREQSSTPKFVVVAAMFLSAMMALLF